MKAICKKTLFISLFGIIFFLVSCEKLGEDITEVIIKLPFQRHISIPDSLSNAVELSVWHEDLVSIDLDSIVKANNLRKLKQVEISELILALNESATYNDLAFLDKIILKVSENQNFDNEIVIAESNVFLPGETEKALIFVEQDVSSFISSHEEFYFRLYGKKTNSMIINDVRLNLKGKMRLFFE